MPPAPGVFTTLRVRDGRSWLWEAHLERLRAGAVRFGLPPPPDPPFLGREIAAATRDLADARVRVSLDADGVRVEAKAYTAPADPWTLRPVPATWSPEEDTMRWKTTAAREAYGRALDTAAGADDALLVDAAGAWLETTRANVFLVLEDGSLATPSARGQLLPGLARAAVLAGAAALGLRAREGPCGAELAARARECFVTNALFLVHPVAAVEGIARFCRGDVARDLRETVARTTLSTRIIP